MRTPQNNMSCLWKGNDISVFVVTEGRDFQVIIGFSLDMMPVLENIWTIKHLMFLQTYGLWRKSPLLTVTAVLVVNPIRNMMKYWIPCGSHGLREFFMRRERNQRPGNQFKANTIENKEQENKYCWELEKVQFQGTQSWD